MQSLQQLMVLVYIKNQLNLKRRRFYKYIRGSRITHSEAKYPKLNNTFTLEYCVEQYHKAIRDMKAMNREIHLARKESGAITTRGYSGQYLTIQHMGRIYKAKDIEFHYFQHEADKIILQGGK